MAKQLQFGGSCDRCGTQVEATGRERIVPGPHVFGPEPSAPIKQAQYKCPNPKCFAPAFWVAVGDAD